MSDQTPTPNTDNQVYDVPVNAIREYHANPRAGNVAAIAESLKENGQFRPIVVRRDTQEILAGNHTWKAAKSLGWETIKVTYVDGITDDQAKRIVLADNRYNDLAEYNDEALLELLKSVDSLSGTGYDEQYIKDLMTELDDGTNHATKSQDDPEEEGERQKQIAELGDVWILGEHIVVCGDSSDPLTLDKAYAGKRVGIVLTDPPYGIDLDTDYSVSGGRKYKKVANDDVPFDASFLRQYFRDTEEQFWWGANYYHRTVAENDLDGSWLVWDKRTENTDVVIGSSFELCWSAKRHKQDLLRYHWTNFNSHVNDGHKRARPTEKPIDMLVEMLTRWAPKDGIVADPFAGAGTTLFAAHSTGRVAAIIELDPHYVDTICRRYQKLTGVLPVLQSTGKAHDFMEAAANGS